MRSAADFHMPETPDDKKQTFTGLAAKLGRLPADKRRVALEMSAALAAISLKVSREFVEAVPRAAERDRWDKSSHESNCHRQATMKRDLARLCWPG